MAESNCRDWFVTLLEKDSVADRQRGSCANDTYCNLHYSSSKRFAFVGGATVWEAFGYVIVVTFLQPDATNLSDSEHNAQLESAH